MDNPQAICEKKHKSNKNSESCGSTATRVITSAGLDHFPFHLQAQNRSALVPVHVSRVYFERITGTYLIQTLLLINCHTFNGEGCPQELTPFAQQKRGQHVHSLPSCTRLLARGDAPQTHIHTHMRSPAQKRCQYLCAKLKAEHFACLRLGILPPCPSQ